MNGTAIDTEILVSRIQERVAALGTTVNAASDQTGSPSLIPNIIYGKSKHPRIDTVERIATVLQTSVAYLTGQTDNPSQMQQPVSFGEETTSLHRNADDHEHVVPVRGIALGAVVAGRFEGVRVGDAPLRYVPAPPAFRRISGIYAIIVAGESMSPQHMPRDLRFVHPEWPCNPGDTVIVRTQAWDKAPEQAYIKHYGGPGARGFHSFSQINPGAKLEIPDKFIKSIDRVLTTAELFG